MCFHAAAARVEVVCAGVGSICCHSLKLKTAVLLLNLLKECALSADQRHSLEEAASALSKGPNTVSFTAAFA